MSPTSRIRRQHDLKILAQVEASQHITQRDLAKNLGIALGLTNLLVRRLVKRGWIEVVRVGPRAVVYLLTPSGVAAKARRTRNYLERTVRLYTRTRDVIRLRLHALSAEWTHRRGATQSDGHAPKRIVFYGAGEVAEIGYVCLQGTDLQLAGVVDDDCRRKAFFGTDVVPSSQLSVESLGGQPFDVVVIMSFRRAPEIRKRLERMGFPPEKIFSL